jgi:hypothetical protein
MGQIEWTMIMGTEAEAADAAKVAAVAAEAEP